MALDPISLSASIIALAEAGFAVGRFLSDTFKSYKNAPEDILEIAHEVNICSTLMGSLGEKLKDAALRYSESFRESVEYLVKNVRPP